MIYYQEDGYTIHKGNAFEIMPTLPSESVDLVITSPRYNVGISYDVVEDFTDWETYYSELMEFLKECYRLLVPGGILAVNLPKEVRLTKELIEKTGKRVEKISVKVEMMCEKLGYLPRESIVWVKGQEETGPIATTYAMGSDNNIYIRPTCEMILLHSKDRYYYDNGTGRRGKSDVPFLNETKDVWWQIPERRNGHPAPFPQAIPERLIDMFTCLKEGSRIPVVLDPFMGSGTTLSAARWLGRHAIGIELSEKYCSLAKGKISQQTMFPGGLTTACTTDTPAAICEHGRKKEYCLLCTPVVGV